MSKLNAPQDEEVEGLLQPELKAESNTTTKGSKSSKGLIVTVVLLLALSLFLVITLLELNNEELKNRNTPASSSFIQRKSHFNMSTVENAVIKPEIDSRTYRYFDLPNGMKVMVISDLDSSSASASVTVKVGSFEDTKEMQGLAHFCEHMVFMKSDKYQELDGFQKYVSAFGGSTNAFTQSEATTYYFEITSGGFQEALDRFAQFFISPIFTEELMKDEVTAIDGELHRNLNNGGWRLRFLLEIVSDPKSPLSKFNTGSKDSLVTLPEKNGVDIVKEMQNFFDRYYSANLMSGVVILNQPIDDVEKLVKETFSQIPNNNRQQPKYDRSAWPYIGEYANKLIQYIPVDPLKSVQLIFCVESSLKHPFLEPYLYLTQILGDKGEGGLLDVLSRLGYGNSINVGTALQTSEFEIFLIDVNLSGEGFNNIEKVAKIVFAYLDLVMKTDLSEEYYNQFAQIRNSTFNFVENDDSVMEQLSEIVSNLWLFPPKYGVSGSKVANQFNKKLLTEYIGQLNPNNLMVFVRHPNFNVSKNPTDTFNKSLVEISSHLTSKTHKSGFLKSKAKKIDEATQTEAESAKLAFKELNLVDSLYGITYSLSDLPTNFLDELREVKYQDYPDLKLPDINEFVSDSFKLVDKPCLPGLMKCQQSYIEDNQQKAPDVVVDDPRIRVWHQLYRTPQTPMIETDIIFYSKEIQRDVITATLANLKAQLIAVLLEEEMYQLTQAGNSVSISAQSIQITAFSDVLPELLSTVLKRYNDFDFTEDQFNEAMSGLLTDVYYGFTQTPYANLAKFKSKLLLEYYIMEPEIYEVATQIDYDIARVYVQGLYSPLYCETLFIGNILQDKAVEYGKMIVDILGYQPPEDLQQLENRVLDITGHNFVYRIFEPTGSKTQNMIQNTYQDGILSTRKLAYLQLMMKVMEMEVYSYIRSEQQIGYFVSAFAERTKNVLSVGIIVESNTLNPNQIDEQIELALKRSEEKLKSLDSEQFINLVKSLEESLSDEKKTLSEKASAYLNHIVNQDYVFDMKYKVIEYLKQATKEGLLEYFDNLFKLPRKLSVQFYSNNEAGSEESVPTETLPKEKQLSGTDAELLVSMEQLKSLSRYPLDFDLDWE